MKSRIFRLIMPLAMMTLAFTGCRNANKNVEQTPVPESVTDKIPEIISQEVISTIDFNSYRASNSKGVVSFGNELFVLDSTMSKCYFRFSLDEDEKNLKS